MTTVEARRIEHALAEAVNKYCSCGGNSKGDVACCKFCVVFHEVIEVVDRLKGQSLVSRAFNKLRGMED